MSESNRPDPEYLAAFRKAVQDWIAKRQAKEKIAADLERIRQEVKRKSNRSCP